MLCLEVLSSKMKGATLEETTGQFFFLNFLFFFGKEKVYFVLQFIIHHEEKLGEGHGGKNLKAGTEVEDMEEKCLLACSPWFAKHFSYTNKDYMTRGGTVHSDWAL